MTSHKKDVWASGAAYEPYVGRWSRLVAPDFVGSLGVAEGGAWVDVGCGTGALTEAILKHAAPRSVESVDSSAGFVEYARHHVRDTRASFMFADARALPQPNDSAEAVVSGLVLNFVPQPADAVGEMRRVAKPGSGVVAAYVWDYAGRMDLMRYFWDAAVALDPAAEPLDEGRRFPICNPDALTQLFRGAGLGDVTARAIDVPTRFRDFYDYWTPFIGGQGPAPGYAMSLTPDRRESLRQRIRDTLPTAADGSINMIARAWAVRGVKRARG